MKKFLPLTLFILLSLTACDGWSYNVPTFPAPPATITPAIYTPTPIIVSATYTKTPASATDTPTDVPTETSTTIIPASETATVLTETPTPTDTAPPPPTASNIVVQVLGCNTSIDITHGMGEVTNAYVTLQNNTGTDLSDLCTTLYALDEGRVHPDKTVCIPLLEHGQQVTLKLTVDSTYKQETPIQVEVTNGDTVLSRVDSPSCTNLGFFSPAPDTLLTPVPIP